MVRDIVKDESFLSQKSVPATKEDLHIAQDLLDTLNAHLDGCVGMAANMIGELKNIIVIENNAAPMVMINPKITKADGKYKTEEGCLSLEGQRTTYRFKNIRVRYSDMDFKEHTGTFTDFTAEIIQHEIDHCNGKII